METIQILFTLFCTIVFCLGWRMVTDEDQLLYFLRKPFENLSVEIDNQRFIYTDMINAPSPNHQEIQKQYYKIVLLQIKLLIVKPLILCITCMASVWGAIVFYFCSIFHFNNIISFHLLPYLTFNCIAASFIQTFIWKLYAKLD